MNSKEYKFVIFMAFIWISISMYYCISKDKDKILVTRENGMLRRRKQSNKESPYVKCGPQQARTINPNYEIYYVFACYSAKTVIDCSETPTEFGKESIKISESDFELYRSQKLINDKDLWKNPYWVSCYGDQVYICSKGKDGEKDTEDDVVIECPNY